jgi:hypothetical protein
MDPKMRKVVISVAILNLAYFGIEFSVALIIGSVSLFADSVDFLEDASINLLIAAALGWSATSRARLGMALAGILLVPGLAALDSVGQVHVPHASCASSPDTDWRRRAGRQSHLRAHAGPLPDS